MKTLSIAVGALALLIPALASAQTAMVYRPELRGMVPQKAASQAAPMARSDREEVARHEAMARAFRANAGRRGMSDPAVHCDRLVTQLRKRAVTAEPVSE